MVALSESDENKRQRLKRLKRTPGSTLSFNALSNQHVHEALMSCCCLSGDQVATMSSNKMQDSDERFLRVQKDPRFWEMPERERKIKIDKRFQSMFHDKRFKVKYTVDKRGRPINHTSTEDLKRFYKVSDSEEEQEEKTKKKVKKEKAARSERGVRVFEEGERTFLTSQL